MSGRGLAAPVRKGEAFARTTTRQREVVVASGGAAGFGPGPVGLPAAKHHANRNAGDRGYRAGRDGNQRAGSCRLANGDADHHAGGYGDARAAA